MLQPRRVRAGCAQLFYSKKFPGSKPEYQEIRLDRTGKAEYREGPDEDNPIVMKLKQADIDEIFALSDKLGHFDHEVESGLKVARMGEAAALEAGLRDA